MTLGETTLGETKMTFGEIKMLRSKYFCTRLAKQFFCPGMGGFKFQTGVL